MGIIITIFYSIWILLYALKEMVKEEDYFISWQDFKDFISAWKEQVKQFKSTLK